MSKKISFQVIAPMTLHFNHHHYTCFSDSLPTKSNRFTSGSCYNYGAQCNYHTQQFYHELLPILPKQPVHIVKSCSCMQYPKNPVLHLNEHVRRVNFCLSPSYCLLCVTKLQEKALIDNAD